MTNEKIKINVLILPHFEIGEMTGDFPGEAQFFYEEYCMESEQFQTLNGRTLYINLQNGVAICITGPGKVNNTAALSTILSDPRFDLSDGYIMAVGCAGGASGVVTLGDVCLVTAAADYDLGHMADIREMNDPAEKCLWFHDKTLDVYACRTLDEKLNESLYGLIKDIKLETTENSKKYLKDNFGSYANALREPKVIKGTALSGDNYWKGKYGKAKAEQITEFYGCKDPYTVTEMEDIAISNTAWEFGMLDRLVIIRTVVNMDVFTEDDGPEARWGNNADFKKAVTSGNSDINDIFETAMHNMIKVGKVIIDQLLTK